MKKLFINIVLFFSAVFLFAAPPLPPGPPPPDRPRVNKNHKNFNGKRFPNEDMEFKSVIIRTFDISDMILLEVLFNNPIDSNSITSESIQIDCEPVDLNQLRFSKTRQSFRYLFPKSSLKNGNESFMFEIKNIKSVGGKEMASVELKDCAVASEYRFSERENTWKKF